MDKILCLDFDGVCHSYVSGWQGIDVIQDPPVEGLFEFIAKVHKHFEIHIFSVRSSSLEGREAMKLWFERELDRFAGNGERIISLKWLRFPDTKPPAYVSLDDRVLTFTGEWPETNDLVNFKPWNK